MSKKILKYTSIVLGSLVLLIIFLSTVGFETDKFNNQIQNLVKQKNDKFDTSLKKIKLTLDPLNFKVNAKTIDAKITFNNKPIELEYIQTQISLNSLIKNQLVASQIEISTKPILLKNFVSFIRSINNRPELFFLERFIKKGYLIADLKFNFENEKVLNSLNHKNINLIDNQATVKFYSEAHALNYAVNHFNEIEILAPQSIVNKISIRKKELIKKLKI